MCVCVCVCVRVPLARGGKVGERQTKRSTSIYKLGVREKAERGVVVTWNNAR